jgi:hypothetical protein
VSLLTAQSSRRPQRMAGNVSLAGGGSALPAWPWRRCSQLWDRWCCRRRGRHAGLAQLVAAARQDRGCQPGSIPCTGIRRPQGRRQNSPYCAGLPTMSACRGLAPFRGGSGARSDRVSVAEATARTSLIFDGQTSRTQPDTCMCSLVAVGWRVIWSQAAEDRSRVSVLMAFRT